MKLITTIIKPFKLEEAREASSNVGVEGITVAQVKGFGRQRGHPRLYRGAEHVVAFPPKVKLEVAIEDSQLDSVVESYRQRLQDRQDWRR